MTIKYNDRTYDAVDNGDGTFTLSPTAPQVNATVAQLKEEYRNIKAQAEAILHHRDSVNADLQALKARRDELKLLIQTSGIDPDSE